MMMHVIFKESTTCHHRAEPMLVRAGTISDVSDVSTLKSQRVLSCHSREGRKDLRFAHGGQSVSVGQGELVVVVGVGLDSVSAFGEGVRQEGLLEPSYEFALGTPASSAPIPQTVTNEWTGHGVRGREERTS